MPVHLAKAVWTYSNRHSEHDIMAQVTLTGPITGLRGTLSKKSGYYFRIVNGKTYLYKKSQKPTPKKAKVPTQVQKTQQELFRQATAMSIEIMKTEHLLSVYTKEWKAQKRYKSLHGYIFADCYNRIR